MSAPERQDAHEDAPKDVVSIDGRIRAFLLENYGKILFILGLGSTTGLANAEHGPTAVLTAGLKQCAYSGISATILLAFYDFLAKRTKTLPGELIPMMGPALLTIVANYGMHNLSGTAEPALSTLPTATLAMISFPVWHIRKRILELWRDIENIKIEL